MYGPMHMGVRYITTARDRAAARLRRERLDGSPYDMAGRVAWFVMLPLGWFLPERKKEYLARLDELETEELEKMRAARGGPPRGGSGVPTPPPAPPHL